MSACQPDVKTLKEKLRKLANLVCDVSHFALMSESSKTEKSLTRYRVARDRFEKLADEIDDIVIQQGTSLFEQCGDLCVDASYTVIRLADLAGSLFDVALARNDEIMLDIAVDMYLTVCESTVFLVEHCGLAKEAGKK